MSAPRDPTSAEIALFLSTRSGDQMMQLVQSIREPAAQATLTASLLFVPPAVEPQITAPQEKIRKALNAFVGFRCYYILIPVFKPWPMKKLSNLMGLMWETDSNKLLWSLMAKAWSVIRDQIGKDKAPLDQFFRIICPYLNIPSPETYLEHCGWTLNTDEEGTPTLSREFTPSPCAYSDGPADTAISVEDIINYCQSMGYAQEYISDNEVNSLGSLAQSCSQFMGKSTSVKSQAHVTGHTYEGRLAARNKRRAKRQVTRDMKVMPELQQQIVNAHVTGDMKIPYQDSTIISRSKPLPFYDDFADLLKNRKEQDQQVNSSITAEMITAEDPMLTPWINSP